jgi:HAAS
VSGDEYLRRVASALRDLPWRMRRDLLSELRGHLAELPAGTDLRERLGPPEQYAADLRAAAELEHRRGPIAFLRARRPRHVILAVLALAVLGLAIGAVEWVDSYQPIVYGNATQLPLDSTPSAGRPGVTVVFRKGRPFEYGITIRNAGRLGVRVLGVPSSPADFYSGRLLMSGPQKEPGMEKPWKPFHPFEMKPGEIRWLVFKGVYACTTGMGATAGTTWTAVPVRFSFLWRTGTARIPLDEPLQLVFPKGCPPPR